MTVGDLPERLEKYGQQLRKIASGYGDKLTSRPWRDGGLMLEGAARIRSLEGENARLTALLPLQPEGEVVEGWRLVPVEPTSAMMTAAWGPWFAPDRPNVIDGAADLYRAMLDAAPDFRRASEAYAKRGGEEQGAASSKSAVIPKEADPADAEQSGKGSG